MYIILVILLVFIRSGYQFSFKPQFYEKNEQNCVRLLKTPHYQDKLVTGQLWREYYSWNVMSRKCQTTQILEASPAIIARFEREMTPFMKEATEWTEATMLLKSDNYEMLMFHGEGPPGRYKGIPNLARFGDMYIFARRNVEHIRFAMKLLREDKFLVMLDCKAGLGHVMSRVNDTVDEDEVFSVAQELNIGKGYLGCQSFIKPR